MRVHGEQNGERWAGKRQRRREVEVAGWRVRWGRAARSRRVGFGVSSSFIVGFVRNGLTGAPSYRRTQATPLLMRLRLAPESVLYLMGGPVLGSRDYIFRRTY